MKEKLVMGFKKLDRFLRRLNMTLDRNREAEILYKSTAAKPDLRHPSIQEAKQYWRKYGIRPNPKWHAFCASFNGIHSSKYVPEDVFFNYLTPSLNDHSLAVAYSDKNMYDIFMRGIHMPKTILRCIHGKFHDADYTLLEERSVSRSLPTDEVEGFIKPAIDSGKGKNIQKCRIKDRGIYIDGVLQDVLALRSFYKGNFIIQQSVVQAAFLADIYPYSLNCLRSASLRYKGKIVILYHFLKFGNDQNFVDNTGAGGVVCCLDRQGNVSEFAYDGRLGKTFAHPFTKKPFKNLHFPNFEDYEKFIADCHEKLPHFDFLGWDIGLDDKGQYVMIEHNFLAAFKFCQIIYGPVLEEYLDGILDNLQEPDYR